MDPNDIKNFKSREKREVERFRGSITEYSFEKDATIKKTSFLKNISIKGVCIVVNKKIDIDKVLYLTIHLPGSEPPISSKGQVIWQKTSTDFVDNPDSYYDIGVAFTNLSDYGLDRLTRLLRIKKPYRS